MDHPDDLHRLLSLKRHEAPPPEYFEDFLVEFHQRQRAELLKRSLWSLVVDRVEAALPVMHFSRYAYAGGCAAAVVIAGITSTHILSTPAGEALADNRGHAQRFAAPAGVRTASSKIDFYASRPAFRLSELDFNGSRRTVAASAHQPRYVLDSQPVSYEQPFSF